jgi:hypothetical protein
MEYPAGVMASWSKITVTSSWIHGYSVESRRGLCLVFFSRSVYSCDTASISLEERRARVSRATRVLFFCVEIDVLSVIEHIVFKFNFTRMGVCVWELLLRKPTRYAKQKTVTKFALLECSIVCGHIITG